jgi:hypothetical protein
MPSPYRARVDARRFLNLPGFHGGAYIVAYVEDTSQREVESRCGWRDDEEYRVNPEPRIILEIADCSSRINLELELGSDLHVDENSLHKVDTLLSVLAELRDGLVEEAGLYRERQVEVDALNARAPR